MEIRQVGFTLYGVRGFNEENDSFGCTVDIYFGNAKVISVFETTDYLDGVMDRAEEKLANAFSGLIKAFVP